MPIREALKKIDKKALIKKLVKTGKYSEGSINTAFSRGQIKKEMAVDIGEFTSTSPLFWMLPGTYNINGSRK